MCPLHPVYSCDTPGLARDRPRQPLRAGLNGHRHGVDARRQAAHREGGGLAALSAVERSLKPLHLAVELAHVPGAVVGFQHE